MKWLYKILRLFFCPHKYDYQYTRTVEYVNSNQSDKDIDFRIISKCRYCGKFKKINNV